MEATSKRRRHGSLHRAKKRQQRQLLLIAIALGVLASGLFALTLWALNRPSYGAPHSQAQQETAPGPAPGPASGILC